MLDRHLDQRRGLVARQFREIEDRIAVRADPHVIGHVGEAQANDAQTVPDPVVPSISSTDPQELKAMSLNLAAVRQKVDLLAAGQAQMTRDFTTKLQAAEQEILDKISVPPSQPAAAPVRKPASPPLPLAPAR